MNKPEKFAFGTDFHGNLKNIDLFLQEAVKRGTDHIIFGGDIAPKKMAVEFKDGTALKWQGKDFNAALAGGAHSAQEAYESGYMLFPEEQDLGKLAMLRQVIDKIYHERRGLFPDHIELSRDELQTFLQVLLPLIRRYLTEHENGRALLSRFIRMYASVLGPVKDPATFIQGLDEVLRFNLLSKRNRVIKPEELQQLFPEYSDKTYAQISKRPGLSYIPSTNLEILMRGFVAEGLPWNEWTEILDNLSKHALEKQRRFAGDLFRKIAEVRQVLNCTVSAILGNDDDSLLIGDFDEAERNGILIHATNKIVQLNPDVQVAGYSFVPPVMGIEYAAWFKDEYEIEPELDELLAGFREDVRYKIANIHCPPTEAGLAEAHVSGIDQTDFGSAAVQNVLAKRQPHISLHGHIHDSWRITNAVSAHVGKTVAFNPGASEYNPRLLYSTFEDPETFEIVK